LGQERAALEVWVFYLVWVTTFAHAWLRSERAWIEQCWATAGLAVVAVLLNWTTTGDHLFRSVTYRHLWPVAGIDIVLLLGAAIAVYSAIRVKKASAPTSARISQTNASSRA
jgi:hypothetical protein